MYFFGNAFNDSFIKNNVHIKKESIKKVEEETQITSENLLFLSIFFL